MTVDTNTKLVFFLGKPLGQSISTAVLNRVYEYLGINYLRIPVEVSGDDFIDVLTGMRHMNMAGFNVTKPNKIAVVPYLDELDPLAASIGAVNCVTCRDGVWKGYNTDAEGFYLSLSSEMGVEAKDETFFCYGAGGAGRAMCFALAHHGAKRVYISSRTLASAEKLAEAINVCYPGVAVALPNEGSGALAKDCPVILNASGMGMAPHLDETPMDKEFFTPGQIAYDAIYNPAKTRFLAEAEAAGCRILNGKGMLQNCNMLGFRKICELEPPRDEWDRIMAELSSRIQ